MSVAILWDVCVGQLWPRVNKALSTMGRQQLDPLMKESKPSWVTSVVLDRQACPSLLDHLLAFLVYVFVCAPLRSLHAAQAESAEFLNVCQSGS